MDNIGACETPTLEFGVEPLAFKNRGYYIYVTEACNLRCDYCFVKDKENHRHLTREMADKILRFVKTDGNDLKETYIHLFGGEPLMNAGMVDYLAGELRAWAEEQKLKLKLGTTTNGTLLTEANCEMLKRHDFGVQLSLDGSREGHNVHRQLMGGSQCGLPAAGAFDLVQIDNYFKYFGKGRPNARMTVTAQNLEYLSKSVRELHEIGFKSFSIIPDFDSGKWNKEVLAQYEAEMEKVYEYWASHREIDVNAIQQVMDKLAAKRRPPQMCGVGRTILGITVDGDIYPCHDFSGRFWSDPSEKAKLLIGNVEKGYTANQSRYSDLPLQNAKPANGHDCSTCWAKWACGGGCPYMNYAASGDIWEVNATFCATNRIHATLALRWMSALQDHVFMTPRQIFASRQKLARAVLHAAGGEEDAAFGRNAEGKALLPGPQKMRELGFDPFESVPWNGPVNGPEANPAIPIPQAPAPAPADDNGKACI